MSNYHCALTVNGSTRKEWVLFLFDRAMQLLNLGTQHGGVCAAHFTGETSEYYTVLVNLHDISESQLFWLRLAEGVAKSVVTSPYGRIKPKVNRFLEDIRGNYKVQEPEYGISEAQLVLDQGPCDTAEEFKNRLDLLREDRDKARCDLAEAKNTLGLIGAALSRQDANFFSQVLGVPYAKDDKLPQK